MNKKLHENNQQTKNPELNKIYIGLEPETTSCPKIQESITSDFYDFDKSFSNPNESFNSKIPNQERLEALFSETFEKGESVEVRQGNRENENLEKNQNSKNHTPALSDKNLATLYECHKKGFLTSSHIKDLIYPGNCQSSVTKALKRLQDMNLIKRRDYILGRGIGRQANLYYLSSKGLKTLKNAGLLDCDDFLPSFKKHISYGAYAHRKAILDFWVCLENDCKSQHYYSLSLFFPDWQSIISDRPVLIKENDEVFGEVTLRPDATFIIKDNISGKKYLYFLEMDMGTIPFESDDQKDIANRLLKYQLVIIKKSYQNINPDFYEIDEARVIFMMNQIERLRKCVQDFYIDERIKKYFLFTILSEIKDMGVLRLHCKVNQDKNIWNIQSNHHYENERLKKERLNKQNEQ